MSLITFLHVNTGFFAASLIAYLAGADIRIVVVIFLTTLIASWTLLRPLPARRPQRAEHARSMRDRLQTINDERGSISVFMIAAIVILIVIIGLVVDSAGKYSADARAQQIASNAARSAVNAIGGDTVLDGSLTVDTQTAEQAAENYLTSAGMTGTVTVTGEVVNVEAQTKYTTKFLSIIGINQLPGHGAASAQLITQ